MSATLFFVRSSAKDGRLRKVGIKNKQVCFVLHSFFRNFAIKIAKLLRLGNKNKQVCFVLLSTFRNFAEERRKKGKEMGKDKVTRLFNEALKRYQLITDGDRILVGLSGGKDSMALLELLARRARIFVPRFEVEAAFVRMTDIPYQSDEDYLRAFAASLGVSLHVVETSSLDATESGEGADAGLPSGGEQKKPVCFQCSWQRRKKLFETAKELGCNKIALGHHRDDLMQTALMNLTFQGQFSTMRPMMAMDRFPMTLIRPLCLIREREMEQWAASHGYQKQIKNCPFESASTRFNMKHIVAELEQMNPEFAYTFYRAIERTF